MALYIWNDGQWCEAVRRAPKPSVAPAIHRDGMNVAFHPGSGSPTESKSTFRRWNREHGYTEMGTDAPTERKRKFKPAVTKDDLYRAKQMLDQGYRPDPLPTLREGDFAAAEVRQ